MTSSPFAREIGVFCLTYRVNRSELRIRKCKTPRIVWAKTALIAYLVNTERLAVADACRQIGLQNRKALLERHRLLLANQYYAERYNRAVEKLKEQA